MIGEDFPSTCYCDVMVRSYFYILHMLQKITACLSINMMYNLRYGKQIPKQMRFSSSRIFTGMLKSNVSLLNNLISITRSDSI